MNSIQTKICGITTVPDANVAKEAGADAIGLNFYAKSKRFIAPEEAAKIVELMGRDSLAMVGVFVNSPVEEIVAIARQTPLSHVQLHGDELPELVAEIRKELPTIKLIRAVRIIDNDFELAQQQIELWESAGVDLLLLDAASATSFGGTGKQLDWGNVTKLSVSVPWLLAGGLNADNVADAIRVAKPHGVDVASGVESAPGLKDKTSVKKFVFEAKQTLG